MAQHALMSSKMAPARARYHPFHKRLLIKGLNGLVYERQLKCYFGARRQPCSTALLYSILSILAFNFFLANYAFYCIYRLDF